MDQRQRSHAAVAGRRGSGRRGIVGGHPASALAALRAPPTKSEPSRCEDVDLIVPITAGRPKIKALLIVGSRSAVKSREP